MLINRKAQIGETITWVVATIIIIGILTISVFISSAIGEGKGEIELDNKQKDLLVTKSLTAYLLTKNAEGKSIYEKLGEEENLNEFNGKLAKEIFEKYYEKEYPKSIWMGFVIEEKNPPYVTNDYFGSRPTDVRTKWTSGKDEVQYSSEEIQLNEEKKLELILMSK